MKKAKTQNLEIIWKWRRLYLGPSACVAASRAHRCQPCNYLLSSTLHSTVADVFPSLSHQSTIKHSNALEYYEEYHTASYVREGTRWQGGGENWQRCGDAASELRSTNRFISPFCYLHPKELLSLPTFTRWMGADWQKQHNIAALVWYRGVLVSCDCLPPCCNTGIKGRKAVLLAFCLSRLKAEYQVSLTSPQPCPHSCVRICNLSIPLVNNSHKYTIQQDNRLPQSLFWDITDWSTLAQIVYLKGI